MRRIALCLIAAAALSAPAFAAEPVTSQAAGQLHALESAARLSPRDGGAYIELAQAYARAGRPADARDAYRHALALDNAMLETRTGDAVWSHQIAQSALASEVTLTSR